VGSRWFGLNVASIAAGDKCQFATCPSQTDQESP
jgi:hypothetical protein